MSAWSMIAMAVNKTHDQHTMHALLAAKANIDQVASVWVRITACIWIMGPLMSASVCVCGVCLCVLCVCVCVSVCVLCMCVVVCVVCVCVCVVCVGCVCVWVWCVCVLCVVCVWVCCVGVCVCVCVCVLCVSMYVVCCVWVCCSVLCPETHTTNFQVSVPGPGTSTSCRWCRTASRRCSCGDVVNCSPSFSCSLSYSSWR